MATIGGTNAGEVLNGTDQADTINGLLGDDSLNGLGGDDVLIGGDGTDQLSGGDGNDVIFTGAAAWVDASNYTWVGGSASDVVNGGAGHDRVYLNYASHSGSSLNLFVEDPAGSTEVLTGSRRTLARITGVESFFLRGPTDATTNFTGGAYDDAVWGGVYNDTLLGGGGADQLYGAGGNDRLTGGAGDDFLDGGVGNQDVASFAGATTGVLAALDTAGGGAGYAEGEGHDVLIGIERLEGSTFADTLIGDSGANQLDGKAGNDILSGGPGNDVLIGGGDSDTVDYAGTTSYVTVDLRLSGQQNTDGGGIDTISSVENVTGSAHDDRIWGDGAANRLEGGAGADALFGEGGDDVLSGGDGDDWLYGSVSGSDLLLGGAGADHLFLQRSLQQGEIVGLEGGAGDDELVIAVNGPLVGPWPVVALGGDGADTFRLISGWASLNGQAGSDTFLLDPESFAIGGSNVFYINGFETGPSGDRIDFAGALSRLTNWDGGNPFADGHLRLTQSGNSALVDLDVSGAADGDQYATLFALVDVQASSLTAYNFFGINPTGASNSGADVLTSGPGADSLDGGPGVDTADYGSATSYVTVDLRVSVAQNTDGGGQDTLISIENVTGSNFDDRLWGNDANNTLRGGAGDDQLDGGLGDDTLDGGSGFDTANYSSATSYVTIDLSYGDVQNSDAAGLDTFASIERVIGGNYDDRFWGSDANNFLHGGIGQDQLNGRGGEDLLDGGANHDILTGGAGPDVFVFRSTSDTHWDAPDRITDFQPGDRIDIGDIDANTTVGGNQAFHIALTPEAAGVYISYDAGSNRTTLRLDTDGDGNPEGRIWLDGDHRGLTNADFVL